MYRALRNIICLLILPCLTTQQILCAPCQFSLQVVAKIALFLIPQATAIQGLNIMCDRMCTFIFIKDQSQKVCQQISQQITPLAIQSVLRGYFLNPGTFCQKLCSKYKKFDPQKQVSRILNSQIKNSFDPLPYTVQKLRLNFSPEKGLRILHVSDIHLDLNYKVGASIACQNPICCHSDNGYPENDEQKAPPFGHLKCDTPYVLFESFLNYTKDLQKVDLAIISGDFSAHDEWQKTKASIRQIPQIIDQKIKKQLEVQHIINNLGNNDFLPDHQLGESEPIDQILKVFQFQNNKGQYFTVVSLNTIVCDNMNLNLILSQSTAIRQLAALQQILERFQNIFIVSHIAPTCGSCSPNFRLIYRALVAKYKLKIRGQFHGHSHNDQFLSITNPLTGELVGMGFSIGSISPFFVGSSRFRIYQYQPLQGLKEYFDYKNVNFNSPEWKLNYIFNQFYGITTNEKAVITFKQLQSLKKEIMSQRQTLRKYVLKSRETNQERHFECKMIDDDQLKHKCFQSEITFAMKLQTILKMFQGNWIYEQK